MKRLKKTIQKTDRLTRLMEFNDQIHTSTSSNPTTNSTPPQKMWFTDSDESEDLPPTQTTTSKVIYTPDENLAPQFPQIQLQLIYNNQASQTESARPNLLRRLARLLLSPLRRIRELLRQ
jgi:hypothetical protein